MTPVEIKRTTGYFTGTATSDFPLDCNGMEDMQANESLLAVLGNIGGGQYILSAPTVTKGGYIFLSTEKEPAGELLYIEKMDSGLGTEWFYVHTYDVDINAQGYNYTQAYQQRWLKWGQGDEKYRYRDFKLLQTNKQLTERCDAINTDISNLSKFVRGMIMMWHGGVSVPDGWWVCDGTHGTPNLRGRFIAASDNTADYSPGAHKDLNVKEVKLSVDNLPPHTHTYYSAGTFQAHGTGSNRSCPGDGQTSNGNFRNLPFDIRPSYYALIFIMKL